MFSYPVSNKWTACHQSVVYGFCDYLWWTPIHFLRIGDAGKFPQHTAVLRDSLRRELADHAFNIT
jgi:hypothetical protein